VNVAEQLAVPRVPATRVQGLEVPKLPVAVPVLVKVTVPVGVICVPGLVVGSLTVAVQFVDWVGEMLVGEQVTVVFVGRVLTTTLAVPVLEL
jgi:hypothetical protein